MKTPLNHCNSEMMHSGGWAKMRTINSPGTTGNKEAVKHNDKIMNKIGTFNMPHSPLNKNEFDIDYSGAKAVDLGSISNAEAKKNLNTKFKAAKDKWVAGYGGPDNPEYKMDKGGVFYEPVEDRIRTSYLEYPEDADHIGNDEFLGKNWDNSPLNVDPFAKKKPAKKEKPDRLRTSVLYGTTMKKRSSPYEADKTPRIKKKKSKKIASPLDCWDGYERVPGTKEFSKGSCRKK